MVKITTRSVIITLLILLGSVVSHAQGSRTDNIVISGQGKPVGGATIAVCSQPANVTTQPCSPLSTLYTDTTDGTACTGTLLPPPNTPGGAGTTCSNPLLTDGFGNYHYYAPNTPRYTVQIYGQGIVTRVLYDQQVGAASAGLITSVFGRTGVVVATSGDYICTQVTNCSAEPNTVDAIRYVSPTGNDANDGLSWGTAKLTIYNAILSLPGGNAGTLTAGAGRIILSPQSTGVAYGGPASGGGLWLMGASDPNFGSPPTGWLKISGVLEIACGAPEQQAAHGHSVLCQMNGGSNLDRLHPLVWISSNANSVSLDHIYFQNFMGSYVKYGIDSNNNRTGTGGSSAFSMKDVGWNFGSCALGKGPGVDIGSNSFWIWMENITGSGCPGEIFTLGASGLSRSGGVVTATTTSNNDIALNDWVTIQNAADPTFNGSFQVTGVTSATIFTYAQGGPTATSGSGQVVTAAASAISVNPGNTGSGSGLVFINNINLNNGGIRLLSGLNGGSIYVSQVSYEGDFSDPDMPVFLVPNGGQTPLFAAVNSVQQSDLFNSASAVQIDNNVTPDQLTVSSIAGNISGTMTVLGGQAYSTAQTVSPLKSGQTGILGGRLSGPTDSGRRSFAPPVALTTNLAATNPASWSYVLGAGTITSGIRAPDGTTGAASATSNSGQSGVAFYQSSAALNVGDIYVAGVWMRITGSGSGFSFLASTKLVLNGNGFGVGDTCAGWFGNAPTAVAFFVPGAPTINDGQWVWLSMVCKIYSAPNTPGFQFDGMINNPSITSYFYAPTLLKFTSGTITDNEAVEIANNLASIPTNCPAQGFCEMPGQQFGFAGSTQFEGLLTHGNTANRTYTFPDNTGTMSQTIASGTAVMTVGLINAGACGSTVTVGATGAATTDSIEWAFNAAPLANPAELVVSAWPTSGNVNFQYCNPTAGGVTPNAATLNWRVIR